MPVPLIRPRTDTDLPACVRALSLVHEADAYPSRWPGDPGRWLRGSRPLDAWVAVGSGGDTDVLGHVVLGEGPQHIAGAACLPPESIAVVKRLFVTPAAQRRGLAVRLLDTAVQAAADRGLRPMLDVVDDAPAAIALYERAGWRFLSQRTAEWLTAAGIPARVRTYISPMRPSKTPAPLPA